MISLSISFLLKIIMGRWLTEVLISCMARLGKLFAAIMALAVSGLIFSYSSSWNATSSSRSENCLARILWKSHTILTNWLNSSSISSELTVSPVRCGSRLVMTSLYSFLGAYQTVAIWIKSQERLMLIPHALRYSSRRGYTIMVSNTWVIRRLKERGTKRGKKK